MRTCLVALFMLANGFAATAASDAQPALDTPLVVDKSIKVDVLDVEASLTRIPPEKRAQFRMSYDRVAGVVDGIFVARSFAEKARALGLDQDPAVQRRIQQVQEEVLANAYNEKLENEVMAIDLERRAKELYTVQRDKYVTPELIRVQHILVDLKGRTRETARERANEVYAKAKAGETFLDLAERYSDDPGKSLDHGDLEYAEVSKFMPALRAQLAKVTVKGEISPPIEDSDGFHIFRLVDRKPSETLPFEAVSKTIIATERDRLKKQRLEAELLKVRSSPTAVGYPENVEKLVVTIDPALVRKAIETQNALGKSLEAQQAK